jgi:hypothetical protein
LHKALPLIFLLFLLNIKNHEMKTGRKRSPGAPHTGGAGPPLAVPAWRENTSELVSVPVSSCDFPLMYNFHLYNPPEYPRSVYRFLVVFCFELFLSGVDPSFEGTMASSNDDKEKASPEDNHQYLQPKEEVESETEEEDQGSRTSTMIASIGVMMSHDKFKKSARIKPEGVCHATL